jgi:hypothetical protein
MKKAVIIILCSIFGIFALFVLWFICEDMDLFDELEDMFSSKKTQTVTKINGKTINFTSSKTSNKTANNVQKPKFRMFQPKVNIKKSAAKTVEFQNYNNGLFSMKIPKGWVVGTGKSDYIHYTFMVYNPANPDYKIFFNMKTEGYLKTQKMKNMYKRYYPKSPFAQLPVISPQTTEAFYKVFTKAFNLSQSLLPFKVPVINNFSSVQTLGKNITGGSIVRAVYQNEQGKPVEGVFTATIKEFAMPPVVLLIVYNTVFFTAPANELVDWLPVLNYCVSTIRFSDQFINGYYREEGQVVANANAIQAICNQTSDIITSGWNARQKTYDILSQKRSDATMGYERVRDTDTGEIYKATVGFTDHDWHGKYEPITDDMYNLPTAGYIEKW